MRTLQCICVVSFAVSVACGSGYDDFDNSPRSRVTPSGSAVIPPANAECAHFCNTGLPPGPERGQCASQAAHGDGLCAQCEGDLTRLCTTIAGQHFCADLQSDPLNCGACGRSCAAGQSCATGLCCTPHTCDNVRGTTDIVQFAFCGDFPDGCGGTLHCGSCPAGQFCVFIETARVASRCEICSAVFCEGACGVQPAPPECGRSVDCGPCGPPP